MTEIQKVKAEIKMLEKKLSFLEELEKTKSPVEEAYKDWLRNQPDHVFNRIRPMEIINYYLNNEHQ